METVLLFFAEYHVFELLVRIMINKLFFVSRQERGLYIFILLRVQLITVYVTHFTDLFYFDLKGILWLGPSRVILVSNLVITDIP